MELTWLAMFASLSMGFVGSRLYFYAEDKGWLNKIEKAGRVLSVDLEQFAQRELVPVIQRTRLQQKH